MYIEQLYTNCLAEAAYYIESEGEAVIIDPLRETEPYLELAQKRNAKIKYVLETHFHADFVSGHIDLARKTGATIVYGPTAQAGFEIKVAKDNEILPLGKIKLKVLHTPGHTMESSCFLLIDEHGQDYAVFTGDTLFVNEVGRPDLAVKGNITMNDLAGMLYDSLYAKILPLADDVIVYPGHGAGSSCGKNIGKETFSTIKIQKLVNYALQPMSKEAFIKAVTEGLPTPPKYFFMDAMLNKQGYDNIDNVIQNNTRALSIDEFDALTKTDAIILDTRTPDEYEKGTVVGSINIGLNGQYAPWVGSLIDTKVPLILITNEGKETEAVLRLARVGYENVKGFLKGGMDAWRNTGRFVDETESINPEDFLKLSETKQVIDVRNPGEWKNGIVENANLIALAELEQNMNQLDKSKSYLIHCAGGYRSMMAVSLLKKNGFKHVVNVRGGITKMIQAGVPTVLPEMA